MGAETAVATQTMDFAHLRFAEPRITAEQTAMAQIATHLADGIAIKAARAPGEDAMQTAAFANPRDNLGVAQSEMLVTTDHLAED